MTSIRRFMVIVLLATITLLNFLAALHGYRSSMEKSQQLFDKQLSNIAQLLVGLNAIENDGIITAQEKNEGIAYQIWNDSGELVRRSMAMPEELLLPLKEGYSYVNYDGYRWRTLVRNHPPLHQWVVVLERTDIRYALAEEVVLTSVLPIVAELPVIGVFIWLIIGWGLRPLRRLANELGDKDPQDLTPLVESNVPKELTELIDSSNGLLYRLNQSFEREKRFSGDAAHELRTPISALKIHLYNLRKIVPEENESLQFINVSVDRMSHLVEQMLALYRTTPDKFSRNFQKFDFYEMTQKQSIDQYHGFAEKNQSIELAGDHCVVLADEFSLKVLVKNLLDNANKYTPEGGKIKLSIVNDGGELVLTVDDSGEGIDPALYGRVFERFYRVHGDQHNSNVMGCGLGFSIVQHIVELHKGAIKLGHSCFDSGLKVTVSLPLIQGNPTAIPASLSNRIRDYSDET